MTLVARPADVLDAQAQVADWWRTVPAQVFGESFLYSLSRSSGVNPLGPVPLHAYLAGRLDETPSYYVTAEMGDKLWGFAKRFETVGLLPQDLPTPKGFLWLDKPLCWLDVRGTMMGLRAVLWSAERTGVTLSFFSDLHDDFDEMTLRFRGTRYAGADGELPLNHMMAIPWGAGTEWVAQQDPDKLISLSNPVTGSYERDRVIVSLQEKDAVCRFVLCAWEFLGEQLPWRAVPGRAGLRRLERTKLVARDVLVVDLRTHEQNSVPTGLHVAVDWQYRWRVREHPRRWTDKNGNERVTTVKSYLKGPEDAPLLEKTLLYKVRP